MVILIIQRLWKLVDAHFQRRRTAHEKKEKMAERFFTLAAPSAWCGREFSDLHKTNEPTTLPNKKNMSQQLMLSQCERATEKMFPLCWMSMFSNCFPNLTALLEKKITRELYLNFNYNINRLIINKRVIRH